LSKKYLPAPRPHTEMRLNEGNVSIRRGELSNSNLCSYCTLMRTTASVQPNVNKINDFDANEIVRFECNIVNEE